MHLNNKKHIENAKRHLEEETIKSNKLLQDNGYQVTKEIDALLVDENSEVWTAKGISHIFKYSDIVSIDYIENGISQPIS